MILCLCQFISAHFLAKQWILCVLNPLAGDLWRINESPTLANMLENLIMKITSFSLGDLYNNFYAITNNYEQTSLW